MVMVKSVRHANANVTKIKTLHAINTCTHHVIFKTIETYPKLLIFIVTIRYYTIEKFNVDSKPEYSALSSTRSCKNQIVPNLFLFH